MVLTGVSGSTFFFINNHVNIAIMYVDQINYSDILVTINMLGGATR